MEWTTTSQDFTVHHFKYNVPTLLGLVFTMKTHYSQTVFEMMNCEILPRGGPLHLQVLHVSGPEL